jgi:hypothetical protein
MHESDPSLPSQQNQLIDSTATEAPPQLNKKKRSRAMLIAVSALILISVGAGVKAFQHLKSQTNFSSKNITTPTPTPQVPYPNPPVISSYPDSYSLEIITDSGIPTVIVSTKGQESTRLWSKEIPDLYVQHYHNLEFHHGYLYAVHRVGFDGYQDEEWTDELWRYGTDGSQAKLFSVKGLDFRAASSNRFVAVKYINDDGDKLVFINHLGSVLREYGVLDLSSEADERLSLNLINWTGDIFRGEVAFTAFPSELFAINVSDFSVTHYSYPEKLYGFMLNPENLWTAATTMPIFFEEFGYQEYMATNPTVKLVLYNLETQATIDVAQAPVQPITYEWLDAFTLHYATESDSEKKQYSLKN